MRFAATAPFGWILRLSAFAIAGAMMMAAGPLQAQGQDAPATRPSTSEATTPGDGATTRHEFLAVKLAFNQRTLAGDYRRVGSRNPKWDADVESFLDGIARYFTRSGEKVWYVIDAPATPELLDQSTRLVEELGCDDPLVLYCHALLLMDRNGNQLDEPWAEEAKAVEAYERIRDSDYNAFRKASAARRVGYIAAAPSSPWINKQVTLDAEQDTFKFDVACFTEAAFTPEEARVMLEYVWKPQLEGRPNVEALKKFADAVAGAPEHEWASLVVQGDYHRTAGYAARGTGFADTVSPEGWQGLEQGMTEAGRLYQQAHAMHPDRPEAAAGMIVVALTGFAPPGKDERYWFEQAIAAQLDYADAWLRFSAPLMPRWGGSHRQMVELGRQALATERWDTDVPHRYAYQIWSVAWDVDGDWQAVRDFGPAIWQDHKRMYAGIIKPLNERGLWNANQFAAERLARAWVLHEWEEAAALLAPGGEEPGVNSYPYRTAEFARVGATMNRAVSEIAARTGDHADAVALAEAHDDRGDTEAADAAWKDALAAMAEDDPGRHFVECRLRERAFARLMEEAPEGEWVDVPFDLAYWEAVQGDWRVEDGALIGTATLDHRSGDVRYFTDVANPTLVFLPTMPDAYDVRVTIGHTRDPKGEPCVTMTGGLLLGWGAAESGGARFNLYSDLMFLFRGGGSGARNSLVSTQPRPVVEFGIGEDGAMRLTVNERVRMERYSSYVAPAGAASRRIAINTSGAHLGDEFTVHSLQVRRAVR